MSISGIHQLAFAGLLKGIDKFIISAPSKEEVIIDLKEKGPFFPKISEKLTQEEKNRIEKVYDLLKVYSELEKEFFLKYKSNFPLLDKLEEKWSDLSFEEVDSFFIDFRKAFSSSVYLPHCHLLSALAACGDYPVLFGGRIINSLDYITSFPSPSPYEGELLTGRFCFTNIFSKTLPLFEARNYPLPLTCLIISNAEEFYAFLPGPVSPKGNRHVEELNEWFWNKRMAEISLSWESMEFSLEELGDMHFSMLKLAGSLEKKSLNIFSKKLFEEGKHIFHIDFQDKICPLCKKRTLKKKDGNLLCSICAKEIAFSERNADLSINTSPLRSEEKSLPEILKENMEELLLTYDKGTEQEIPLFYPILPEGEEEKKLFCRHCALGRKKKGYYNCLKRKTCSYYCMAALADGKKDLFFGEIIFSPFEILSHEILSTLYKNNIITGLIYYLKSSDFLEKLCLHCSNKFICTGKLRCISFYEVSRNALWFIGAWDRVLKLMKILSPEIKPFYGRLSLFSPENNLSSIIKENSYLINHRGIKVQENIEIFGKAIKNIKLNDLIDFSEFLVSSIKKKEIDWNIIYYMTKCSPMAEDYFEKHDTKGLKMMPLLSYAIKNCSGNIKDKLKILLELEREKTLLPYIDFIVNYIKLKLDPSEVN